MTFKLTTPAGEVTDGGDRTSALVNGFVPARTNTGNDARQEPSGSFIPSNPQKAIDYAFRAVHVTADTARKVAADYYGSPSWRTSTATMAARRVSSPPGS